MPSNQKQSEKDYLRKSGGGDWEMSKPFPPVGQTATEEHAQHFLDFSVLLRVLALRASDLVLDLGAGSCWVTDWLRRCGIRAIAVDISTDMLRLGSERMASNEGLVAGDMEELPFRDGVFSKACCLNAFHHVPDVRSALRDIHRVLAVDGTAFFSEPGAGHAANPTSVAAVRNYGVLEQEILINDFMAACLDAGFVDVRLHPISHAMPLYVLTGDEWRSWCTYTKSKRPIRAVEKLWRAALELVGLGKKDRLFEEALAIRLARELQPLIEQHPIITAHKVPFARPVALVDSALLSVAACPSQLKAQDDLVVKLRIVNTGTTFWDTSASREHVRIGVQLLHEDGSLVARDYERHDLPRRVGPGDALETVLTVKAPAVPAVYQLRFDMVREGVHWFELTGSRPVTREVRVV